MFESFTRQFAFNPANRFCIGVEQEVWTVDPSTGVLVSGALRVFKNTNVVWLNCKPELPAQQIEVITPVCTDLAMLDRELKKNDVILERMAKRHGFAISRAPVPEKPFAVHVFPKPRYLEIEKRVGKRLRGAYVAGLHVHIGVGAPDEAIRVMNACRAYLPVFLALSARSPIYAGQNMRCKSYRFIKYREMAGEVVPPYLTSWEEYAFIAQRSGFLEDPRNCWWAMRISPHGTVELRICDVQEDRSKTLALAALFRWFARDALMVKKMAPSYSSEMISQELDRAALGRFDPAPRLRLALDEAERLGQHLEEPPYIRSLLP